LTTLEVSLSRGDGDNMELPGGGPPHFPFVKISHGGSRDDFHFVSLSPKGEFYSIRNSTRAG